MSDKNHYMSIYDVTGDEYDDLLDICNALTVAGLNTTIHDVFLCVDKFRNEYKPLSEVDLVS
jgi:hypothetical protein